MSLKICYKSIVVILFLLINLFGQKSKKRNESDAARCGFATPHFELNKKKSKKKKKKQTKKERSLKLTVWFFHRRCNFQLIKTCILN